VLFSLSQIGFGFALLIFLFRSVKTDYVIILLHQFAVGAQESDGNRLAPGHRNLQHLCIAALKIAFGRDGKGDIAPLYCCGWHVDR